MKVVLWIVVVLFFSGCIGSTAEDRAPFTLEFPQGRDLGELWLVEDVNCFTCGNGRKDLGRATGTHVVRLPAAHWFVSLRMPKKASALMPHLAQPSLAAIGDINLAGSDVKDDDLKYLAGTNLQSINLSGTMITGSGLKYLRAHSKWIFVDLTNCPLLDPESLAHFMGWKRSTIRLVPYKWGDDGYSESEKKLLEKARTIICDDQPEEICHTQIR